MLAMLTRELTFLLKSAHISVYSTCTLWVFSHFKCIAVRRLAGMILESLNEATNSFIGPNYTATACMY